MAKRTKVHAATVVIVVLTALVAIGKSFDWRLPASFTAATSSAVSESAATPQDTLNRMLEAAAAGDVEGYIGCYSRAMRRRLEQSRAEMTSAGLGRYLRERTQAVKGIVIAEPIVRSEAEVEVRVEYVYQDHNEVQQFVLENSSGNWEIAVVNSAESVEALVPYGTPAY